MGNTCIPVADYVKFKNKIKFKILKKKMQIMIQVPSVSESETLGKGPGGSEL